MCRQWWYRLKNWRHRQQMIKTTQNKQIGNEAFKISYSIKYIKYKLVFKIRIICEGIPTRIEEKKKKH